LNYLLVLEISDKEFTFGILEKNALMGKTNVTKGNKAAKISNVNAKINFIDFFSQLMPAEFKGF